MLLPHEPNTKGLFRYRHSHNGILSMNGKTYLGRISEKSYPQETALFEIPENKSGLTGLKKKKKEKKSTTQSNPLTGKARWGCQDSLTVATQSHNQRGD